ncbi:FABP family protein [Microbacterium protaetiae]|uniref:Peroxynitrite isomerase n=1 Tax=Microbacterium protaetiae TaxID=2509458 RepID=A0A4P6EB57_9MICO|nr:FABP family protein [Microbacterium protaetiae]QAY58766.1 FABP family protein [Microbacterium protaetiae]
MIEIPTDLPAELAPLAWLRGVWEGTGVIDYEADGHHFSAEFTHRVSFSTGDGGYLNYSADAWTGDGDERAPLLAEVGYWRLARPQTAADPGPALLPARTAPVALTADDIEKLRNAEGGFDIEVALVHADGTSELSLGQVRGPRIDVATDAVVRPATAKAYTAASRMYGLVEGHLLWAWDVAALGAPMASHASARLAKVQ